MNVELRTCHDGTIISVGEGFRQNQMTNAIAETLKVLETRSVGVGAVAPAQTVPISSNKY